MVVKIWIPRFAGDTLIDADWITASLDDQVTFKREIRMSKVAHTSAFTNHIAPVTLFSGALIEPQNRNRIILAQVPQASLELCHSYSYSSIINSS